MTLLQTNQLTAFYGDAQALFGIDFGLERGEVVAIIGANGAGKSTFLKSLTGLVKTSPDSIWWRHYGKAKSAGWSRSATGWRSSGCVKRA